MNSDQPICDKHARRLTKKIALAAAKYALTCGKCQALITEARKDD